MTNLQVALPNNKKESEYIKYQKKTLDMTEASP